MTLEEAKKMLEAKLKCIIAETSGTNHDCNMQLCDGCALNYEQGNMGEQKEALDMAIKALEQPQWISVGKKIPVAFEKVLVTYRLHYDDSIHIGIGNTTSIFNGRYYWKIDEQDYIGWDILAWMPLPQPYKAESEDKE